VYVGQKQPIPGLEIPAAGSNARRVGSKIRTTGMGQSRGAGLAMTLVGLWSGQRTRLNPSRYPTPLAVLIYYIIDRNDGYDGYFELS
jgi:hypothetical protein